MPVAKILVVEDNYSKLREIEKALAPLENHVLAVRTITDAFRLVTEQEWDLIVLDMTFLVDRSAGFESGRQSMAGMELLQFIARRRFAIPVIVATQHDKFASPEIGQIDGLEALHNLLLDAFPRNYRCTVKVDQSEDSWKLRLLHAASTILESTAS